MSNQAETSPAPAAAPAAPAAPAATRMSFADIAKSLASSEPTTAPPAQPTSAAEPAPAEAPSAPPASVFRHRDDAARKAAQDADRERLAQKRADEAKDAEIAALKARIAEAEANPIAALKLAKGMTPAQFAEKLAKGELELPESPVQADLPEDVKGIVAWAKERQKREAEEREQAELTAKQAAAVDLTKKALESFSSEYPMAAALEGMPQQLAAAIERQYGSVDDVTEEEFRALCKSANEYVLNETRATLRKPAAIKAILEDADTKKALLEALGLQTEQRQDDRQPSEKPGAVSGEPRTLSTRVAGTVSPAKRGLSYKEIAAMFQNTGE